MLDADGMIKVRSVSAVLSPRYFNTHFVTVMLSDVATFVETSAEGEHKERDNGSRHKKRMEKSRCNGLSLLVL